MSKPAASVFASPTVEASAALPPAELLLRTFTDLRNELVSTLWFMLGSREDAQDVAQEAFMRCWRNQASLPDIQNLRAWIFRIGLNAAKDLQRSAWRRRVKPLLGAETMPMVDAALQPAQLLEEQ